MLEGQMISEKGNIYPAKPSKAKVLSGPKPDLIDQLAFRIVSESARWALKILLSDFFEYVFYPACLKYKRRLIFQKLIIRIRPLNELLENAFGFSELRHLEPFLFNELPCAILDTLSQTLWLH